MNTEIVEFVICVVMFVLFFVICRISKKEPKITSLQIKEREFKELLQKDMCKRKRKEEKENIKILIERDVKTAQDLKEIIFLYNEGKFRTQEEIDNYVYDRNYQYFDESRHYTNAVAFVVPFTIVFLLVLFAVDCPIFNIAFALLAGGTAAVFGGLLAGAANVSKAKQLGLDENSPAVENERTKLNATIVASVIGGVTVYRSTKKAIKDIANVDGWKEMK